MCLSIAVLSPVHTTYAASSQPKLSTPVELTTLASLGITNSVLDAHGHFHVLYSISTPHSTNQNLVDLEYAVFSSDTQPVTLVKPITLAHGVDGLSDPTILLDSRGRFHAAWIEHTNGTFTVRHALVEDPTRHGSPASITPQTLYQSSIFAKSLSGGTDASGNTFYAWLDIDSGSASIGVAEVRDDQSFGTPFHLAQQATEVAFPHLAVYPDGTLAVVMQQRSAHGGWDINIYPFDTTGKALHTPLPVAQGLFPGSLNMSGTQGSSRNDFRFDPLDIALDAQQHLHIVWGAVLQLGYAEATIQTDHSFTIQSSVLGTFTDNYQQLCLSTGPLTPPGPAAEGTPTALWLSWIDDSENVPMLPYIGQIAAQGQLVGQPTRLVPATDAASNPCVQQDAHGGLYALWQEYDDNGQYGLFMATTTRAPETSFWTKLGLSPKKPIEQILFILLGSLLMAAFFFGIIDIIAIPISAGIVSFGKRLHIPRLALFLLGLVPLLVLDYFWQHYLAANFGAPTPPRIWPILGSALAVLLALYFWFRSRRIPVETLGIIGRILVASLVGAFILAIPIIYFFSPG